MDSNRTQTLSFDKDILGLRQLRSEQINAILDTAVHFRAINERRIKKVPTLRGQTIIMAFFENSTRTKLSFEVAAKRDCSDVSPPDAGIVVGQSRHLERMACSLSGSGFRRNPSAILATKAGLPWGRRVPLERTLADDGVDRLRTPRRTATRHIAADHAAIDHLRELRSNL